MPGLNSVYVLFPEPPIRLSQFFAWSCIVIILWQVLVLVHLARHDGTAGHHSGDEGRGDRRRQC